jgi:flagella basal body P-ring formation protein FlgA
VEVEAVHGGAHLKLEGIAEGSGAPGETIPIQNPVSKQRFMARVECKGKVVVTKGSL